MKLKLHILSANHMEKWDRRTWRSYELTPAPKITIIKRISRKVTRNESQKSKRTEVPGRQKVSPVPHSKQDINKKRFKSGYGAPDQRM